MELPPNPEPHQAPAAEPLSGELSTALWRAYLEVRRTTGALCAPLELEDFVVQSMPEASPTKWHLGHTSWFFETLVLAPSIRRYSPVHPAYAYLFNSYYESLGPRVERPRRGLLSRPTVREVYAYRQSIDERVRDLLDRAPEPQVMALEATFVLGLHHEQQHQELLLTDAKHLLASNPLRPAYDPSLPRPSAEERPPAPLTWQLYDGGVSFLGYAGIAFSYDNERPRHRVFLEPFQLASRLVTSGEFQEFIDDGGYRRPELWLSDGWDAVRAGRWEAPLYWELRDGDWWRASLGGMRRIAPDEPVCHVSYYEAEAYARWARARLPTEAEWEHVAANEEIVGSFLEAGRLDPSPAPPDGGVSQLFGEVWQWTSSPYVPYPGFRPERGAASEYNGKFMSNQMVLRGGSCATPASHLRATYRNFFAPHSRWQFSGLRLARDA